VELFDKAAKAVIRDLEEEGERLLAFAAGHPGGEVRIEAADA